MNTSYAAGLDRFFRHVVPQDMCWNWTGAASPAGYGQFRTPAGPVVQAYRWLYEQLVAEIPVGLHLDHLCRNPRCVNVYEHLEPVTVLVNNQRAAAHRTHCAQGHPLPKPVGGRRRCDVCNRTKPWRINPDRCDGIRTTNYQYGCRCDLCRSADSVRQRAKRERRAAARLMRPVSA